MDRPDLLLMLIDDNDADNEFHEEVIRRAGFTSSVKSIEDSRLALQYFRDCFSEEYNSSCPLPDLVFLDINMPALNGFEWLDALRFLPDPYDKLKRTAIIMLTGSVNPDDYSLATEKYDDLISGFRVKPLTEYAFLEIMSERFQNH